MTIEVFVTAFSSLAVLVSGAFFWVMTDIRSLRKEIREEFRAERQERRAEREADRQERRAEREADRQERRAEREADKQEHRTERETDRQEVLSAIRAESEARRADTQRILEALYFHRHDPNTGDAIFYPPAPTPQAD